MSWSRFDLGAGVIVAPGLDLIWDQISDLVDVVEVEPQTMWHSRPGGWDLVEPAFEWVEALGLPTLVHGVGFPVGGCHPPDPAGVALTAECAARLGAAHWSEHLSYNRTVLGNRSIDVGFLLPPAQTTAGVEVAAEHVRAYHTAAACPHRQRYPAAAEPAAVMYEAVPESLAALGATGVREILVALHRLLDDARRTKGQDRQPRPRRQRPDAGPAEASLAESAEWERAPAR